MLCSKGAPGGQGSKPLKFFHHGSNSYRNLRIAGKVVSNAFAVFVSIKLVHSTTWNGTVAAATMCPSRRDRPKP